MSLNDVFTTLSSTVSQVCHDVLCCQLIELFTLVDDVIPGYKVPKVITELHAHVWGSSIDYR